MQFGPPPVWHANLIFGVFGQKTSFYVSLCPTAPLHRSHRPPFRSTIIPMPIPCLHAPPGGHRGPFCSPRPLRHANFIFGVFGRKRHFACLYVQLPLFTGVVGLRFDRQSYPCPSHASMHPLGVTQDPFVRKIDALLCALDPPPLRHTNLIFGVFG